MALEVAFELPPQLQEQVFREAVQSELGQGTFLLQARTLAAIASTSRRWRIWAQRLPLTVSLRRLGDELLAAGRRSDRQHPREAGIRAPVWAWLAHWRVRNLAWWPPGTAAWLFNRPDFQRASGATLTTATGLTATADLQLRAFVALESLELREPSGIWWAQSQPLARDALRDLPRLHHLVLVGWPMVSLELPASIDDVHIRTPELPRAAQPFVSREGWRVLVDLQNTGEASAHPIMLTIEPVNPSQPARVRLGWAFLCRCCSEVAVSALDTQLVVGPGLGMDIAQVAQRELEKGRVKRLEFQQLVPESYGSLVVTHNLRWLWSGEGELAAEGVPEADAASVLRHLRSSVSGWAVEAPTPRTLVFQGEPDTEP